MYKEVINISPTKIFIKNVKQSRCGAMKIYTVNNNITKLGTKKFKHPNKDGQRLLRISIL